jgi:hypothetical protein
MNLENIYPGLNKDAENFISKCHTIYEPNFFEYNETFNLYSDEIKKSLLDSIIKQINKYVFNNAETIVIKNIKDISLFKNFKNFKRSKKLKRILNEKEKTIIITGYLSSWEINKIINENNKNDIEKHLNDHIYKIKNSYLDYYINDTFLRHKYRDYFFIIEKPFYNIKNIKVEKDYQFDNLVPMAPIIKISYDLFFSENFRNFVKIYKFKRW